MISKTLLTHELQLGESLNQCVHHERRADFSLMLAMLVDDAQEFSQFKTPQTQAVLKQTSDDLLRKEFDLPAQAPLSLNSMLQLSAFNEVDRVVANDLASIKLSDALSPKPLAFRNDKTFIPTQVKTNTTVYCQAKLDATEEKLAEKRLAFNANEWLKAVKVAKGRSFIAA